MYTFLNHHHANGNIKLTIIKLLLFLNVLNDLNLLLYVVFSFQQLTVKWYSKPKTYKPFRKHFLIAFLLHYGYSNHIIHLVIIRIVAIDMKWIIDFLKHLYHKFYLELGIADCTHKTIKKSLRKQSTLNNELYAFTYSKNLWWDEKQFGRRIGSVNS